MIVHVSNGWDYDDMDVDYDRPSAWECEDDDDDELFYEWPSDDDLCDGCNTVVVSGECDCTRLAGV